MAMTEAEKLMFARAQLGGPHHLAAPGYAQAMEAAKEPFSIPDAAARRDWLRSWTDDPMYALIDSIPSAGGGDTLRSMVGLLDMFNSVAGMLEAGGQTQAALDPERETGDRVMSGIGALINTATAATPFAIAKLLGKPMTTAAGNFTDDAAAVLSDMLSGVSVRPMPTPPRNLDPDIYKNLSDEDLIDAGLMFPPSTEAPVRGYHASPHDFDVFDSSKIGTGEGQQIFSEGLYVAQHPAVSGRAGVYDKAFSGHQVELPDGSRIDRYEITDYIEAEMTRRNGGKAIGPMDPRLPGMDRTNIGARMATHNAAFNARGHIQTDPGSFQARASERRKDGFSPQELKKKPRHIRKAQKMAREIASEIQPARAKIYETEIDAAPRDFLDWDKTLEEQSEGVQKIIRQMIEDRPRLKAITKPLKPGASPTLPSGNPALPIDWGDTTGRIFYGHLLADMQTEAKIRDPAAVAAYLRESGIPGMRYLDGGSRNTGEGTHNYVVYDDKLLSIMRKYGIAGGGLVAGSALSQVDVFGDQEGPI